MNTMSRPDPQASPDQHREQMQALQEEMRAKMRAAKEKKGLLIVHTGNGKGKTTAALGMLTRMLAHGKRCAVIQFIKGSSDAVSRLLQSPLLSWHHVGDGFTWDTQDKTADIACCREGWRLALQYMADPAVNFLLLDELNVVLQYQYLPKDEIVNVLAQRRSDLHVVVTGRDACPELIALADLVSEMREIKHPFQQGIQAQRGIEY